jgi:alpha-mannosidase
MRGTHIYKSSSRRFVVVEMAFLARWMEDATQEQRALMQRLVRNKQIEFINGGWCMHDEAGPLYLEMLDQTTRGHQFLLSQFGAHANPSVAWQIDPFGHSATQAWLLSAEAGMPALFFGRMDYQDFNRRKNESRMEWVWRASQSMGKSADTFTSEIYGTGLGNYGTWVNFEGKVGWEEKQVVDNPHRHGYNIEEWIEKVVKSAYTQGESTRTNHQMWTMGGDFTYQDAARWYTNTDKLMHHVNNDGRVHLLYSTPSNYVKEKKAAASKLSHTWEVRGQDLFPYAEGPHRYWTGYFTSRPALKRSMREASGFLQAARQIEVAGGVTLNQVGTGVA